MQINPIRSSSYSHISTNKAASNTRPANPDDSHGLWREDLAQQLAETRQQVREFTAPLMLEAYKMQHAERLISAYYGQSSPSRLYEHALEGQQRLQRHARNTVLLEAYLDNQTDSNVGTRLTISV